MRSRSNDTSIIYGQYLGYLLAVVFNIVVGAMSVNYLLTVFFEKAIPFFWAAVIGLFAAEVTVPVAIIVWILKAFHII